MSALLTVDQLAAIIREVDGDHTLGAGALAEAILDRLGSVPAEPSAAAIEAPSTDWKAFVDGFDKQAHDETVKDWPSYWGPEAHAQHRAAFNRIFTGAIRTEREMANAWRKRAEEAEQREAVGSRAPVAGPWELTRNEKLGTFGVHMEPPDKQLRYYGLMSEAEALAVRDTLNALAAQPKE